MKKTTLILLLIIITLVTLRVKAQETGIHFQTGLDWQQVLAKAKAENKYIFVDCYATWCAPCKWMDANVYPLKAVGDAINVNFIAIRLQIDRTKTDPDSIKKWYGTAKKVASTYAVNALPTFLFFGPDGKPVHKVSGIRDPAAFIQLTKDAQNPDKQYYSILDDYKPGSLDTSELKGLARSFQTSDTALAGKLAGDYLTRIPQTQWNAPDNRKLMIQFGYHQAVTEIALRYIKGFSHQQLETMSNLRFLADMDGQPLIKSFSLDLIKSFNQQEMANDTIQGFIANFSKEPGVEAFAEKYIEGLTDAQIYHPRMISFIAEFTKKPTDPGFDLFYHHTGQVDAIAGNGVAEYHAMTVISDEVFTPAFNASKQSGVQPNFDSVRTVITRKYDAEYADRVVVNARVSWFSYMARIKKQDQYWPEFVSAEVARLDKFKLDTIKADAGTVNNIAYLFFQHGTDRQQLLKAAGWMKHVTAITNVWGDYDTYACVLYKAGETKQAIGIEEKAKGIAIGQKDADGVKYLNTTIDKMKKGEAIWNEKEYQ